MAARSYAFTTRWQLDAPVPLCWEYLTDQAQGWREWWPSLRGIEIVRTDELIGSRARCRWRSPIGHALTFTLELVDATAREQVVLLVTGDLAGEGVVDFAELPGRRTLVTIRWNVETARRWMNLAAPLLRPVFRLSHQLVMWQGRRGLDRALRRLSADLT